MPPPEPKRLTQHARLQKALQSIPALNPLHAGHPPLTLLSLLSSSRFFDVRIAPQPVPPAPAVAYAARVALVHTYLLVCSPADAPPFLAVLPLTQGATLRAESIFVHGLVIQTEASCVNSLFRHISNAASLPRAPGLCCFRIIRRVAIGECAKVYKVKQVDTGEKLAVKLVERWEKREMQWREAVFQMRVGMERGRGHPFVLQLRHAVACTYGALFFVEYCSNGDLFNYIRARGKPLDEYSATLVVAQLISGLQWLHERGCCAKKLTAENVLIDKEGWVRIASFGGCSVQSTEVLQQTEEVEKRGNKGGETVEKGGELGVVNEEMKKSDMWHLGMLTQFLLTGSYPTCTQVELLKPVARDFVQKLLCGEMSLQQMRQHGWLKYVRWDTMERKAGRGLEKEKVKESVLDLRGGELGETFSTCEWPKGFRRKRWRKETVEEIETGDEWAGFGFEYSVKGKMGAGKADVAEDEEEEGRKSWRASMRSARSWRS